MRLNHADRTCWTGLGIALGAFLLALVIASSAWPRMHHPARGHRILPGGSLLDGSGSFSTSVTGAYSFRKVRSAYTGPAMKLRRTTGGTQDINYLGATGFTGAPWDEAAAQAFCSATTCFIDTWYDQSPLARHIGQSTQSAQFAIVFNCIGFRACAEATTNAQSLFGTTGTFVATSPVSLSAVGNRTVYGGGASECGWVRQNGSGGNRLTTSSADWWIAGSGGFIAAAPPANAAWHTQQGVINGASTVLNIDGTETTGSATVVTTAGFVLLNDSGTAGTTCRYAESIIWDGYALTPTERTFLTNNQRAYVTP